MDVTCNDLYAGPGYSLTGLLTRLESLMRLKRAGFHLQLPEFSFTLQHGHTINGILVAASDDAFTLKKVSHAGDCDQVMVISAHHISVISFEDSESARQLLDPARELPMNHDMGALDLKRLGQRTGEKLESQLGKSVDFSLAGEIEPRNIPQAYNLMVLICDSLLKIGSDPVGKEAIREKIDTVTLEDDDSIRFATDGHTLRYFGPLKRHGDLPTSGSAIEAISKLL